MRIVFPTSGGGAAAVLLYCLGAFVFWGKTQWGKQESDALQTQEGGRSGGPVWEVLRKVRPVAAGTWVLFTSRKSLLGGPACSGDISFFRGVRRRIFPKEAA